MSETSLSRAITDETHPVHDYAKERSFRLRDFSAHLDPTVEEFMVERLNLERSTNPDGRLIAVRRVQDNQSEFVVLRLVKRPYHQAGYYLEIGWLGERPSKELINALRSELNEVYSSRFHQ